MNAMEIPHILFCGREVGVVAPIHSLKKAFVKQHKPQLF
jgi:hypothetical protein